MFCNIPLEGADYAWSEVSSHEHLVKSDIFLCTSSVGCLFFKRDSLNPQVSCKIWPNI